MRQRVVDLRVPVMWWTVIFFEASIGGHEDGTKGYKDEGEEDEDAEHVGVGHEDDQQELGHVKQLLEGTLHAANDPSVLLLDLLLLYLEVMIGRRDRKMNS